MLNIVMTEPEDESTVQHRRDREAYQTWKKKNYSAHIILFSAMDDDIAKQFKSMKMRWNFRML